MESIATELGPEILEMNISTAGWCSADKKMVIAAHKTTDWVNANWKLGNIEQHNTELGNTLTWNLDILHLVSWFSLSEQQHYNNPWNPNIPS